MSGLVQNYRGMKRGKQIRVLHEDVPRLTLGMLGDATRHIDTMIDEDGTVLYRVEDIRDAAGVEWSARVPDAVPVKKAKKGSVFHYTTKEGAEYLLAEVGTRQARAVQQLMD
jgi:hypothetical protein